MDLAPRVSLLESELSRVSQEMLDQLTEHSVRITVAQEDATAAQGTAFTALSRIHTTGLDAKIYTDGEVARLRQELTGAFGGQIDNLIDTVDGKIDDKISDTWAEVEAARAQTLADFNEVANELGLDHDDLTDISNQILNVTLPEQANLLEANREDIVYTKGEIERWFADYEYGTLAAGFDDIRQVVTNAEQTAVTAAQDTAVMAVAFSRGDSVLKDRFCPDNWQSWVTVTRAASTIYPKGKEFRWALAAGANGGVMIYSDNPIWVGTSQARSYRIDIEMRLSSGTISGSGVRVSWFLKNGTQVFVDRTFAEMQQADLSGNKIATLSAIFERPESVKSVDVDRVRIFVAASAANFGTQASKTLTIYKIDVNPMTATEAGVITQSRAIADLEGNASAGYLVKAQAGNQVSLLSLVAADGSGGSVSIAKIEAKDIILQGSVTAPMLTLDKLIVNSAQIDELIVGTTHMQEDSITDFDSANSGAVSDFSGNWRILGSISLPTSGFKADLIGHLQITLTNQAGAASNNNARFQILLNGTDVVVEINNASLDANGTSYFISHIITRRGFVGQNANIVLRMQNSDIQYAGFWGMARKR